VRSNEVKGVAGPSDGCFRKDEARKIAAGIAKLPGLLQKN
jgi:hypothetical protein